MSISKAPKLQSHVGVANWIDVFLMFWIFCFCHSSLKMRLMRKTPQQMKQRVFSKSNRFANDTFWVEAPTRRAKTGRKNATRPRRAGCVGSRGGAARTAAATRLGPDGSAAGAHGAHAAGVSAAAPERRKSPAPRLQSVAPPLPEVCGTPRHAAARPVRLCHGARRGGGGATPGEVRLLQEGTLCVAAAAVPRVAGTGTVEGWEGWSCQLRKSQGCHFLQRVTCQINLKLKYFSWGWWMAILLLLVFWHPHGKNVLKDGCLFHFCMLSHLTIHIHKLWKRWNLVCSLLLLFALRKSDLVQAVFYVTSLLKTCRMCSSYFKLVFGIERWIGTKTTTASSMAIRPMFLVFNYGNSFPKQIMLWVLSWGSCFMC